MRKEKVSSDIRIQVVEAYIQRELGIAAIRQRYGVPKTTLGRWVRKYQTFGIEGLLDREHNYDYTAEIKQAAVEAYLTGKGSLKDICKKYKIQSDTQLRYWIKLYNGHRELRPSRGQGSDIYMTKGRTTTYEERIEIVSFCLEHGNDYTATIEQYGVSYQQIYSWIRKYREKGPDGLVDKSGKRKRDSEMSEFEKLRAQNRLLEAQKKRLEAEVAVLKKLKEIEGRRF